MKNNPARVESQSLLFAVIAIPLQWRSRSVEQWINEIRQPVCAESCWREERAFASSQPMLASIAGVGFGTIGESAGGTIDNAETFCGPESDILAAVNARFRSAKGTLASYGGIDYWPKFLTLRMLIAGVAPEYGIVGLIRRHIDLADVISLKGTCPVPPLPVAADIIGAPIDSAPLSLDALIAAHDRDDTETLSEELLLRLNQTAALHRHLIRPTGLHMHQRNGNSTQ